MSVVVLRWGSTLDNALVNRPYFVTSFSHMLIPKFIIAGGLAIGAGKRKNLCMIKANFGFFIIASFAAVTLLGLAATAVAIDAGYLDDDDDDDDDRRLYDHDDDDDDYDEEDSRVS